MNYKTIYNIKHFLIFYYGFLFTNNPFQWEPGKINGIYIQELYA